MFTGLVEGTGEVISFEAGAGAARLTIAAPGIAARLQTGDSVSVSGVCLTALSIEPQAVPPRFSADLAEETIARTTLSRLAPGSIVNLELPTPAGSPLGGHVVQGHVDGVGTLMELSEVRPGAAETDWVLRIRVPEALTRYIVAKGSITVEGISLTVAAVEHGAVGTPGEIVRIAIIPHTYGATNLHSLRVGDGVNLEVDVLAKYAESRTRGQATGVSLSYLLANGY